eukprot:jgi/Chrzof1/8386/Cz03g08190.t1
MADTSDDLDVTYHRAQGRIDRLEVDNFKSYKGHQQIGPFKNFTAIIGPNGSGKSNLMDAISFVLGVRTQQLRGSLKELLYSNSGASNAAAKPRKGFVKLVYETDAGDEVHFSRIIQPTSSDPDGNYQSVYKINDKTVTWEAYSKKLSGFGILVKVRNFLVFQGDIEKVASRSPEGLTQLFEQISGSDALKQEYEHLEQEKAKAEEKTSLLFSKKKSIMAERKQKKEQKDEAEHHMKMQEQLNEQKTYYFLWQLYHIGQDIKAAQAQHDAAQAELAAATAQHENYDAEIDARRKKQSSLIKERMLLEKKMKKVTVEKEKKVGSGLFILYDFFVVKISLTLLHEAGRWIQNCAAKLLAAQLS